MQALWSPNEAITQENVKKVHKVIFADRKLKSRDIADPLNISKGSVFTIVHGHLSIKKMFSKCMSRVLTLGQKPQRVGAKLCFELFKRNKKDFLR